MIAKDLQRMLSQGPSTDYSVPWWMGPETLRRARRIQSEIEGQVATLKSENREFRRALARLGFAGQRE